MSAGVDDGLPILGLHPPSRFSCSIRHPRSPDASPCPHEESHQTPTQHREAQERSHVDRSGFRRAMRVILWGIHKREVPRDGLGVRKPGVDLG